MRRYFIFNKKKCRIYAAFGVSQTPIFEKLKGESVNKLVSIIVPVYNGAKYIGECLDSLLVQTYKNFEIIIVDDGSTDNLMSVLKNYEGLNSNIVLLKKSNGGVSSARNAGIKSAHGEYLMFVDADDKILSEKFIEELVKLEKFDYVVSGLTHRHILVDEQYDDRESVLKSAFGFQVCDLPDEFFINGFVHTSCSKLYRRSVIINNNIKFPKTRLSEDSFFNIEYLKHIQSWAISNPAYYCYMHRCHGMNATAKFYDTDIDVYVRLYEVMQQLPIKSCIVDRVLYAQFLAIILRCIKTSDLSEQERKKQVSIILKKPYIKEVLRKTKTTKGEWLTGLIVSTGSLELYNLWNRILNFLDK